MEDDDSLDANVFTLLDVTTSLPIDENCQAIDLTANPLCNYDHGINAKSVIEVEGFGSFLKEVDFYVWGVNKDTAEAYATDYKCDNSHGWDNCELSGKIQDEYFHAISYFF